MKLAGNYLLIHLKLKLDKMDNFKKIWKINQFINPQHFNEFILCSTLSMKCQKQRWLKQIPVIKEK